MWGKKANKLPKKYFLFYYEERNINVWAQRVGEWWNKTNKIIYVVNINTSGGVWADEPLCSAGGANIVHSLMNELDLACDLTLPESNRVTFKPTSYNRGAAGGRRGGETRRDPHESPTAGSSASDMVPGHTAGLSRRLLPVTCSQMSWKPTRMHTQDYSDYQDVKRKSYFSLNHRDCWRCKTDIIFKHQCTFSSGQLPLQLFVLELAAFVRRGGETRFPFTAVAVE